MGLVDGNAPSGWSWKTFKDVCVLKRGYDFPTHARSAGDFPLYSANGVTDYIDQYKVDGPGVVTGRSGTIGKVHFVEGDYWPLNTALYVQKFNGNYPRFIKYFLESFNLTRFSSGSAVPTLNRNSLSAELVCVPDSVEEQKRIVEKLDALLSRIDTAIEHLQESATLADALYASSLDQLFEKIYLDYATRPLSTLASKIGSGATPKGGQNAYKESGISLIRSLNVYDSEFKPEGLAFIDDVQAEKLSNVVVEEGDVLLNITGASIARCCVAPLEFLPARVNQHVCIIRPNEELNSTYLNYLLISPKFKAALLFQGAGGATRQALTKVMVSNLNIPLPPLEVQTKLVDKVNRLSKKNRALKELVNSKVSDLMILKASILDSAFKGEL